MRTTEAKEERKCRFCLTVAEKAKEYIEDEDAKTLIEKALGKCREWLDGGRDVAEELYDCLDDEVNSLTVLQERETDKAVSEAWNAVIDAVAFICRNAYEESGAEFFPEPIESVDDGAVDNMVESFSACLGGDEEATRRLKTEEMKAKSPIRLPDEFFRLIPKKNDEEISVCGEKILRLWTAAGCVEMNEAYGVQKRLPRAWAIGDDEGGYALVYAEGKKGVGLYAAPFSDLDDSDKTYLSDSLSDFLLKGVGLREFLSL